MLAPTLVAKQLRGQDIAKRGLGISVAIQYRRRRRGQKPETASLLVAEAKEKCILSRLS